ncbi:DnaJ domain-containing protein, partial [Candidatus Bathyarchaeota archaeon]|nr:DnaJ domain-containing protein [Candidatus Bathyarchaeota archaeon]
MSDDRTPRPRRAAPGRNSALSSGLQDARSGGYAQGPPGYAYQAQSQPAHEPPRGLRPMDSRFSLNEGFAATRQEYEFGDDDALSIFGGPSASMVSRGEVDVQGGDEGEGREVVLADEDVSEDAGEDGDGEDGEEDDEADFYEVLCVPRGDLVVEEVRRAYFRWFELLYPFSHEEDVARTCFGRVQEAFETLVDERKRGEYDSSLGRPSPLKSGVDIASDLGIRVDASGRRGIRPVDFMMGHAVSVGVPGLGRVVEEKIRRVQGLLARTKASREGVVQEKPGQEGLTVIAPTPTVTVSGYTYGLAEGASPLALSEDYHPLLHTLPRHKTQLLRNLCPLTTISLRQDFLAKDPTSEAVKSTTAVEVETDLLPAAALTTRLSHTSLVRGSPTSLGVGLTADRLLPHRPQLSLAATRVLGSGVAFARVDSGHWRARTDETCRYFGEFSRLSGRLLSGGLGPRAASFEVGYTEGIPGKTVHRHTTLDILRGEKAVLNPTAPAWTASLGGTADSLVSSLRYAMELSRTRLEVELCATSRAAHHVAIRNLFPLGSSRFLLGLEVSVSPNALHLSLSLARLNQRLSLPVYMLPLPRTLFLAAAVALLVSAGLAFLRRKAPAKPRRKKVDKRREADALAFL